MGQFLLKPFREGSTTEFKHELESTKWLISMAIKKYGSSFLSMCMQNILFTACLKY